MDEEAPDLFKYLHERAERGTQVFPMRSGTQFVAGPFRTAEEAAAAMRLLLMPVEGNA